MVSTIRDLASPDLMRCTALGTQVQPSPSISSRYTMLARNLLYTAVTRGKRVVISSGSVALSRSPSEPQTQDAGGLSSMSGLLVVAISFEDPDRRGDLQDFGLELKPVCPIR